jgi:hypothetical protein
LSQNSRRLIRATLSVMLGDAVDAGDAGITSNPVIGLARKGRKHQVGTLSPAERQRSIRPMTYEQLALFLRAAQRHGSRHDAVLFLTSPIRGCAPAKPSRCGGRISTLPGARFSSNAP